MEVADGLGIPAVVGWNANDCMYDDCPWYVGRPGNLGDRPGNLAVQNSRKPFKHPPGGVQLQDLGPRGICDHE